MKRRVAITGLAAVTPFGTDLDHLWRAGASGRSGIRVMDTNRGPIVGAPVDGFSPRDHIDAKSLRLMSPAVAFGVAAASLAASDSGLPLPNPEPSRLGVFVGSRGHSSDRQDLVPAIQAAVADGTFSLNVFGARGLPLVNPLWLLKGLANNVLYFVSLKYDAKGPNNNISMGGAAGTIAIGEAFRAIQQGAVDVAFAGGYDSALDVDRLEMFGRSGLTTTSGDPMAASLPFDRRRTGFVPGEGAAFVMLEPLDAARRRGAKLYAEVIGYGSAAAAPADGSGISRHGVADALTCALADASVAAPDAVFAVGLATQRGDIEETEGLKMVLRSRSRMVPVPALTSMLGYAFAAAGVIAVVVACRALSESALPPTINLTEPDPACDLDYVAGTATRAAAIRTVAVNSANFGGAHAALILGRPE